MEENIKSKNRKAYRNYGKITFERGWMGGGTWKIGGFDFFLIFSEKDIETNSFFIRHKKEIVLVKITNRSGTDSDHNHTHKWSSIDFKITRKIELFGSTIIEIKLLGNGLMNGKKTFELLVLDEELTKESQ
jgi:hypothetical protein